MRDLLPKQLLDGRVNIAHPEWTLRLLKNSHDRVSDGAELAASVRRNALRERVSAAHLLPIATGETLKEGRHVVV